MYKGTQAITITIDVSYILKDLSLNKDFSFTKLRGSVSISSLFSVQGAKLLLEGRSGKGYRWGLKQEKR